MTYFKLFLSQIVMVTKLLLIILCHLITSGHPFGIWLTCWGAVPIMSLESLYTDSLDGQDDSEGTADRWLGVEKLCDMLPISLVPNQSRLHDEVFEFKQWGC